MLGELFLCLLVLAVAVGGFGAAASGWAGAGADRSEGFGASLAGSELVGSLFIAVSTCSRKSLSVLTQVFLFLVSVHSPSDSSDNLLCISLFVLPKKKGLRPFFQRQYVLLVPNNSKV